MIPSPSVATPIVTPSRDAPATMPIDPPTVSAHAGSVDCGDSGSPMLVPAQLQLHQASHSNAPLSPSASLAKRGKGDRDEQLEELDEIKIKTMYEMVEDIKITSAGFTSTKKFLYLTNKQASTFNAGNMENVLSALELPESHFVIRCLPAWRGEDSLHAHTEEHGTVAEVLEGKPPEISLHDSNMTEAQISLFVKQCILPVAMQTRALILIGGVNDDSLGMAVQRIMRPVQDRMGDSCPFTIIGLVYEFEVHKQATDPDSSSIARQFLVNSKTWSRRIDDVDDIVSKEKVLQAVDIIPACTHVIIVESLDLELREIFEPPKVNFENTLVESLVNVFPSVCIYMHGGVRITDIADIVRRKIPVIMLDSRDRWPLAPKNTNLTQQMTDLARLTNGRDPPTEEEMQQGILAISRTRLEQHIDVLIERGHGGDGTYEGWESSTLAFLRSMIHRFKDSANSTKDQQRRLRLHEVIEDDESIPTDVTIHDRDDRSDGRPLLVAAGSVTSTTFVTAVQDTTEKDLTDLFFQLVESKNLQGKLRCCKSYLQRQLGTKLLDKSEVLGNGDGSSNGSEKTEALSANEMSAAVPSMDVLRATIDALEEGPNKKNVEEALEDLEKITKKLDNGGDNLKRDLQDWLAVYDILVSDNCFAETIYNLDGISKVMSDVAKIDNLPDTHTQEALRLIRQAWCKVEQYHSAADTYKMLAKVSYVMMLALGVVIVITLAYYHVPASATCTAGLGNVGEHDQMDAPSSENINMAMLLFSLSTTVLTSLITFMNPGSRWHHLRSSALELESEIWSFRTRTGKYREGRGVVHRNAEEQFFNSLKEIDNGVLQSGDLRRTIFFANDHTKWSEHGQYKALPPARCGERWLRRISSVCWWLCCCRINCFTAANSASGADNTEQLLPLPLKIDNHHSPLKPGEYLHYRVHKVIEFYKGRIPHYAKNRATTQAIMVVGSLCGAILAYTNHAEWVGVVSAVSAAVVAWTEFSGTDTKMDRYSNAVSNLQLIQLWWERLPEVERLATKSTNFLIGSAEGVIRQERQGWSSSNQSIKQLEQALNDLSDAGTAGVARATGSVELATAQGIGNLAAGL